MSRFRKIAKCPNCLPDIAGAIFNARTSEVGQVWVCANCNHHMPRRQNKPAKKVTPSQQRILDKLAFMGWRVTKVTFMEFGRDIWIEAESDNSWVLGDRTYGSIGPRGSFKLHTTGIGSVKEVTDEIALSVYLHVYGSKK